MFADDLVILSESSKGLQRAIDRLQDYCTKWGLTINIDKTKVLIFNSGGHKYKSYNFTLNGAVREGSLFIDGGGLGRDLF